MAPLSSWPAGMTLRLPPEENTQRFVPSAFPLVGSNTIPSSNCTVAPSVVQTLMGLPLASKRGAPSALEKSPPRQLLMAVPSATGGDGRLSRIVVALEKALPVREVEQLVLLDRPPDRTTVLVDDVFGLPLITGIENVAGVEGVVTVKAV